MDFSLTEEQQQLKDEARRFLESRYPAEAWNEADWAELAELGWLGVSVPEDAGGAGLSFLEEAVLFEELGRALYPGPYFATVGLALPALAPEQQAEVAAGRKRWSAAVGGLAVDADKVDEVLGPDGPLDPAQLEPLESIDSTRTTARVSGSPVPSNRLLLGTEPSRPARRLPASNRLSLATELSRPWAALACEAVGVAQKALELGIEHASTRQQFGRPIGVFQAVSHQLSNTYRDVELARSLAYWAAWAVAVGDEQAPVAAASAKAFCSEAAVAACERSIQVHGGTGFTWEHVLHRYYKRALWIEQFGATPAELRAGVAAALLD
jgi:alkylation response protein AidB-like acyl-CoA dehydrogenase